jgi:SAM-dependent methyltransferase
MAEIAAAPSLAADRAAIRTQALNLFLVGFLVLFFELTCIRWFAAYVVFLNFFSNVVLIAAFLGMSCGCIAASRRQDWLEYFPSLAVGTVIAALATYAVYHFWSGIAVDVGGQQSPQEVFFGTEYRNPDVAKFVVPIEAIAAVFFVLISLMFVGLGQVLGRAFDAYPNRVLGYTLNIGGSIVGILAFSALSFLHAPPALWFLVSCGGVAYLLHQTGALSRIRAVSLIVLVVCVSLQGDWMHPDRQADHWSPYYVVNHDIPTGSISVNTISHQTMIPFAQAGSPYSLIHLLRQHTGGKPFDDVLVIGAGSGNDVSHALKFGVKEVDAVEIDPVIQTIGKNYHPDHPYQDARVVPHLDDGRHFLRTTERKYDLVVYALVDSLLLHSSYANIRLESYLFTKEAFADVARVLKPGGVFVMYNYYRQGWIIERIAAMADQIFGCKPTVVSLPYQKDLKAQVLNSFTMIIAGCDPRIADAFKSRENFWLDPVPPGNLGIDGFAVKPEAQAHKFERISPTAVSYGGATLAASDDWPFLYLHSRLIPDFTIRSMVLLGVLGLGMVYLFLPKGGFVFDSRMFFLGAAFMLLETRAVTQTALLFGSTWVVNSSVFFTILVLILLANLYVLKIERINLVWHYVGLAAVLLVAALIPPDVFLTGGTLWRYTAPCVLALGPVFFAGVMFARSFRNAERPELALGCNIAGAVVGGLAESFALLLGFQHLLFLALAFYLLSAWSPRARVAATG